MIVNDFRLRGRKRLKVLWEVTGYEVTKASWSEIRTKEQYLKTVAVFWSMNAPVLLPSLPGIGMEPTKIGSVTIPTKMWEEEDRKACKFIPMSQEELAEPLTPRSPNPVSNAPDVGQTLWHPLLVDSEHAYAWWMIAEIQKKAEVKATSRTSRMTGSTPKQQGVVKQHKAGATNQPKGTTSKSGSYGSITPAKSTSSSSPADQGIQIKQELGQTREPKGPPVPRLQASAGIREQSTPRGAAGRPAVGWSNPFFRGKQLGKQKEEQESLSILHRGLRPRQDPDQQKEVMEGVAPHHPLFSQHQC